MALPGFRTEYQGVAASIGEVGEGDGLGGAAGFDLEAAGFDLEAALVARPTLSKTI